MESILTRKGVNVTKSFSPNQLELLADYTVSGSAITSYTFSGLKLNADEEIVLVSDLNNTGATSSNYYVFVNGNSTITNYYMQTMYASSSSTGGSRNNHSAITYVVNGTKNFVNTPMKLTNNGFFEYQSSETVGYGGSSITLSSIYGSSTFTLSQINSLTISASQTNAIGIGSRFQLYKVKGQVQQTWATT